MAGRARTVTALVPTHSHGRLLRYPVACLLAQTAPLEELLIVGDGADEETAEVARELERADERIRFVENPKGPGHGLAHRHAAIAEARGEVIVYLADDDLCLPRHVELLLELLEQADFAHSHEIRVRLDGSVTATWPIDLADPYYRAQMTSGERNLLKFSTIAHTVDAYRRLPGGWTNAHSHEPYRGYFETWREFAADPRITIRSGTLPTVLRFQSFRREEMALEEREAELRRWSERLSTAEGRAQLYERLLEERGRETVDLRLRLEHLRARRGPVRRLADRASARAYSLLGR